MIRAEPSTGAAIKVRDSHPASGWPRVGRTVSPEGGAAPDGCTGGPGANGSKDDEDGVLRRPQGMLDASR